MTVRSSSPATLLPGAAQHGVGPGGRFDADLEAEYIRTRLLDGRTLIRMACLLALAVTAMRIGELALTGAMPGLPFAGFIVLFPGMVLVSSVLLAGLAWSRLFVRWYLPLANILVPARNILAAIAVAGVASRGQTELLMVLPAMVLSPFFFLGLHFRPALVCVSLTIAAFAAASLVFALPLPMLLRSCGFLVVTTATCAVAAWQIQKQSRRSFIEGRLIAQLAEHDALTGAKNRRVFDEHLTRLWHQAIDDGRPLAILLIDVDHFKAYNDRHGHQAGDVALQRVARALQAQVFRPFDLLARYGGEEFAVLLHDVEARHAREIAERMRLAVHGLAIEHGGSRASEVVTISIGAAPVLPLAERGPLGALQLADEALYSAKVCGRNCVHVAAEADYSDLETGVFAQRAAGG